MRTKARLVQALLLVLLVGDVAACRWLRPAVQVTIEDSAGFPLRNARLRIRGQDVPIEEVAPAAKRSVLVRPSGETGLAIEFVEPAGRLCHQDLDVYLDHGLNGEIQILVVGCEAAKVKNRVR
jgi:hypothetical protein